MGAGEQWIKQVLQRAGLLDVSTGVAVACSAPSIGRSMWSTGSLESGRALDSSTPMYAASMTKQLVGVLVAQQVLAGRLHPDDRAVTVLPMLPGWATAIRVRHLLHHTSGLPTTARVMSAVDVDEEQHLTNALVLEGIERLASPDRPAGGAFAYSNIGYVVLAEIVRALTSTSIPKLARDSLFAPLGMTASRIADEPTPQDQDMNLPRTVGDGGWWTSALDLLTWLEALNRERLGVGLSQLVQAPGRLDDSTPIDYAWGVVARPGSTGTSYTHGGNVPGWSAKTLRQPNTDTAVALLALSDSVQVVSQAAVDLHESLLIS